jgi:hypothetical protein
MTILDILQLTVTAIVAAWGIYQTYVTKKLEQEVHYLNVGLDQHIQLLHRARDAIIGMNKTHVFMLNYRDSGKDMDERYIEKLAEHSAYWSGLRGLAFAINDKELLSLVNQGYEFTRLPSEQRNAMHDEMEIRGRSQQLHTRIAQLLELTTKKKHAKSD